MKSKVLPVSEPIINTSNVYGTLFSILSNDEQILPWVYSNFIQLRYVIDWDVYFFDQHDLLFETCPYVTKSIVLREVVDKWSSFKEFLMYCIDKNLYVWCHVNRYYIPDFSEYGKYNHNHEILIYGYDLKNNAVYISDNIKGGAYKTTTCTFEEMELAFKCVKSDEEFITRVNLLKKKQVDENADTFQREHMIDALQRYLFSKRSFDLVTPNVLNIYGLNVYQQLITRIEQEDNPYEPDVRVYHLFWEHKKIMVRRLHYLQSIFALKDADHLIEEYTILEQKSLVTRNLIIKYDMTRNKQLLNKIKHELIHIMNKERMLLGELISKL